MLSKDNKILIVGLGLIGGSYAEGLTKAGYSVGAITRSASTIDYAMQKGIIGSGSTEVKEEYVREFDIIIFGLYPHKVVEWIQEYQAFIKSGALITDVTGIKSAIVYDIQRILRSDLEFVGAHPMAGRELSGVQNANADIFKGANYIVTPTAANTEEAIQRCEDLGRVLGFGNISRLSPERHDEIIGFLSQLTHCIAVSLMNSKEPGEMAKFTGDSFRDLTRIAKINEDMWTELFLLNKTELLSQMKLFETQFDRLRKAIENDDATTMKDMMRTSTERRIKFDR